MTGGLDAMWSFLVMAGMLGTACVHWRRSKQCLFDYFGLSCVRVYAKLWHRLTFDKPLHLPETGPALLISNHTSSSDAAFLTAASRRPVGFVLAQEYYLPILRWLL